MKQSPNLTPTNMSPTLTPKTGPTGSSDVSASTTYSSELNRALGSMATQTFSCNRQYNSVIFGQTNSVVNNFNAVLPENMMTLNDFENIYCGRTNSNGDAHYMSETSSNASSCSSVCGWSYGGGSSGGGMSEHNTILKNKVSNSSGAERISGKDSNARSNSYHHSHMKTKINTNTRFGLESIPEYEVPDDPPTFQPLVPPAVIIPRPFSENISFPTTLQPRSNDRFDIWRTPGIGATGIPIAPINQPQKQQHMFPTILFQDSQAPSCSGLSSTVSCRIKNILQYTTHSVSYTHLRAHET